MKVSIVGSRDQLCIHPVVSKEKNSINKVNNNNENFNNNNNNKARELSRLWKVKTTVIPVVIGALGPITNKLSNYLKLIGVNISFKTIKNQLYLVMVSF